MEMDIDGWEILSDDSLLDFKEDDADENHIFSGKKNNESKSVFDNYFCTSPKSKKNTEASRNHSQRVPNQLFDVQMQLEPRILNTPDDVLVEENTKDHVGITMVPSTTTTEKRNVSHVGSVVEGDVDTVSQVFFKMNENEFVKKEMESPKSSSRVICPPLDPYCLKFEDKDEAMEIMTSPRMKVEKEMFSLECDKEEDGFNFWKWSLSGIGSVCTIGVAAAATICVLYYGSKHKNKLQQHHKIQFQIYTDDKRIKQVVQHATKLNEAISVAARGVPLSRAHITFGGYYDGL
ncbi:hypothetical protein TanjilG_00003 [Lupinus angustifolius]|uniref:DUF6821 domain-containing protein n=1 Tax=Lupinus angustifolius TaxID=3871 RepID=A0A4P1QSS1_LUPAN|nr:PREDICTED: uncharacterized protein LOC109330532 [Lupinus angustifolius]XP_019420294.1 PREDICTED: uncharacterized protein LOC109330532 [Lupinus angustifolius]OIV94254.1 hypothetical protein TanjilG_00003 [Lupinus angustifolius]